MTEEAPRPVQVTDLTRWKREGKRFAMLTAYDYTTAVLLDRAEIPVLLVGDSMGGTMLGYQLRDGGPDTLPVTLEEMISHAAAVGRGARRALVVGDLPFLSYHLGLDEATRAAGRLLKEARVQAVKLEGGGVMLDVVRHLVERGIPVMGHLGLTPQRVHAMGGYRVAGRSSGEAERILAEAHALVEAGIFALVVEGIPRELAARMTREIPVPVIGIGAGPDTDGQVLVLHDLLGWTSGKDRPRFARPFSDGRGEALRALATYARSVREKSFPSDQESFHQN